MKHPRDRNPPDPQLRSDAEAQLASGRQAGAPPAGAPEALLHELQVHQIELEMVNESLLDTRSQLEESLQRYLELFEFAPVGYFTVTQTGLISDVNLAGARLLGRPREALLDQPFASLVAPDDRARWDACLAGLQQAGGGCSEELDLLHPGNTELCARVDCVRQATRSGGSTVLLALTDVTARRRAEAALRSSEARLRGIFDSATDAILTVDQAQLITMANPAAARMFRCPSDQMIGAPLERFMPERSRAGHHRDLQAFGEDAVSARHMGRTREVMGLRGDGEEFPIDVAISHLNLDGRQLYTAILRDITDSRRIEQELRAGKATLEAALSSIGDAVFISDVDGHCLMINHAYARFHRLASTAECPITFEDYLRQIDVFLPGGEPAPIDQWPVPRALRGETAIDVEYRLRRKDTGESWTGNFSFAPIRSDDGLVVGSVVTARDITELAQRQAELESAHRDLQRLLAEKDKVQEDERKRIARDLHDDLQQTLAAIGINATQAMHKLAQAPKAAAPLLARVDELASAAIKSARRIVNGLQPQMLEDLGLVPALEALAGQFSRHTGIPCQFGALETAGDTPVESASIATSLYRIAQEALNNVAKHAQATSVQMRLASAAGGKLVLRVTDNGKGMGLADRKKLQSFGLLGIQERVRALGGVLRISSQLGAGTAIEVIIPLAGQPAARPDTAAGDNPVMVSAASRPRASAQMPPIQDAIDALPGSVAVLDAQGVIRFVNRAWREFAERNGDPGMIGSGPGVNYLAVCRRGALEDEQVGLILRGVQEVLDGRRDLFMAAYPCHSPHEQRWFLLQTSRMAGGDIQVTHLDVSHVADVVRQPRPASE